MGCITRPAFLPLRGRRAASQFAPRAGRTFSATRTTLHKLRHAGSRWRAASKLQATDAICSPRCMEFNQRDFRRAARVPRSCRDVYFDISIDIPHAPACLLHLRWTRRRHDLDQSNPAWTSSNIIVEIYGTNQVVLDSTRHTMTYEPSTASSRLQMRQRRALGLSERGRRHRSNENRPDFTPCLRTSPYFHLPLAERGRRV